MKFHSFLIKYGEIGIKGKNRYIFEDALVRQIRYALQGADGEFLVHKCIKDADEIERPEVRKRYGFFSSIVGIICNVILFASKLAIGLIAGSNTILRKR